MNLMKCTIATSILLCTACGFGTEDTSITDLYLICDRFHNITDGCDGLEKQETVVTGYFAIPGSRRIPHVFPRTKITPLSRDDLKAAMHPIVLKTDQLTQNEIEALNMFDGQVVTVKGRLRTSCDPLEMKNISDNDTFCGDGKLLYFDRFEIEKTALE